MQVIFTKHEDKNYSVVVTRSDRVKLQFRGVGKKFLVPHDLCHFIVESKLNMRRGFWGCVANGALFPDMNIIEGRQKPNAKSNSKQIIKDARQQLRLAECLVCVFDKSYTVQPDRALVQAQKQLSQISSEIKPQLSSATILDICSILKAVRDNWQTIDVGENIELGWNQKFPGKSLNYVDS